jgi:hypothetical protein
MTYMAVDGVHPMLEGRTGRAIVVQGPLSTF